MKNNKAPNFIVAGFPKCGTSFLHRKINENKNIWMPDFEPVHFCTDLNANSLLRDEESYSQIFEKYRDSDNILTGEKTSGYAASDFAMDGIKKYNENIKIILTLRNPVDAVISYHNHNIRMGYEPIIDLEDALLAQEKREKENYLIPFYAIKEKKRFQYYNIFSYLKKIAKILDLFGSENVKIVLLDDIINQPQKVMNEVFLFLGVGKTEQSFDAENKSQPLVDHTNLKVRLFYLIHYSFRHIRNKQSKSTFLKNKVIRIILLGLLRLGLTFIRHPYRNKNSKNTILMPEKKVYRLLAREFSNDIDELSLLLQRDLSNWKKYEE
jgi:hypothetical protein